MEPIQIDDYNEYKICIIDSDSNNFEKYNIIKNIFPLVDIHYVKNKNYEYGVYKYGFSKYPNYDIYYCTQDTCIIKKKIDLTRINNNSCYCCCQENGFSHHISIKELEQLEKIAEDLQNTNLNYKSLAGNYSDILNKSYCSECIRIGNTLCSLGKYDKDKRIIDTNFNIAQFQSFIVSNFVMKDMFETLINPPYNKEGSCCYERIFGLYFLLKNIETIDLTPFINKQFLGRQ